MPSIFWHKSDGEVISETSDGLRYVRSDGSLVFRPFDVKNFRPDVHTTSYRCVASNDNGLLGSRDVHVEAGEYAGRESSCLRGSEAQFYDRNKPDM